MEKEHRKSTLMNYTKEQLVEYCMCLEHNNIEAQYTLDLIFKTLIDDKEKYSYLTIMPESVEQNNRIMLDLILRKYSRKYRKYLKKKVERRCGVMAERCIYADDFLDLFYVASAGQDKMFVKVVEQVVEDTPTADIVEVVRCEKCKHKQELDEYEKRLYIEGCVACTQISPSSDRIVMLPTDFCSYGERRDE